MSNANVEALYPLTPLQQGMLFHAVFGHEAHAYVVQLGYRLHGAVDTAALRRAWQDVLDRHPALRTAFLWERREKPLQVVRRGVELPWTELDWRGTPADELQAKLEAFRREDRARGFELNRAPLMRFTLIRLADDERELVWTHHHMIGDGWSVGLMLRDMVVSYEAYTRGEQPRLAGPPPYQGYMAWLNSRDMAAAEAFWRRALAGFTAPTPLPLARPASASVDGDDVVAEVKLQAGEALTECLQALARERQITLNTLVQGAWALVLGRAAGEDDVVFGAVTSGRPVQVPGVEQIVGMFINTLPVRSRIEPGATVAGWLTGLQAEQAEAREHDYTPLVQAQQWSEVPRGTGLFDTLVVYENYPVDPALRSREGRTLDIRRSKSTERTSYPVTLIAHMAGPALHARILYDTRRYDAAAAERLMSQFRRALEAFAANPDALVAAVDLLTDEERALVVDVFNRTETAYPRAGIDTLFAEQAAAAPDAVAVSFGERRMTYGELDAAANRIARHLRALGVGAGTRVGICVERSPEMIAGILAIVKAGGAYVPLDPAYPAARLSFMMTETALPVLISTSSLVGSLPRHDARVVLLDEHADAIAGESDAALESVTGPESPAYVMYTSGSTGTPKGIVIPHRGVVRLVRETDYISIDRSDVFLQMAPVSFDAATLEIWGALLNGARLAVHPAETPGIDSIQREVAAHGVTILWLTAGLFHLVVDERVRALNGVRQLLAGGDVLSPPHVRAALRTLPGTVVINGYGPTEGTTFTCCHRMEALADDAANVPIGKPIANTRAYVLDASMRPVPVGVPGELYIGGAGVAQGYINPALTAQRFVASPFVDGDVLYRSGDRVRWRADGVVEFLGRIDTQVKIRGFRIEPGEIEAALLELDGVRDAVVIVREDVPGDRRLVAYAVGEAEVQGMRDALKGRLPEYMLPSAVVAMEVLPLTENGKVDRRALPAPEAGHAEDGYLPPRTPTEEVLAGIWSEVLAVAQVGARDSFFELGGHSLLATRAVSRIREVFGVELPLRALFESPVLAELATAVDALRGAGEADEAAPPVVPVARDGALPLSFAQERLWFLDQMEPGSTAYHVPSVLRLSGALDTAAMERALDGIVRRHESLRTVFAAGQDGPVQVITPAAPFVLPLIDLSAVAADERDAAVRGAVKEETGRPFDLATGPLFRAVLVRAAEDDHVLALTLHHAVTDGWSMGVLYRELTALYETYVKGAESVLPPLRVQYADHAAWQRAWLAGAALQRQLAWWKRALAGAPAVLELPTDRPRPAVFSGRGARRTAVLPAQLAEKLAALGRREGVTMYMTLMAAWQLVLSRWSGQDDVVVGTPIAGRTRAETEGVIGLFVNTLAVRGDLGGDPAFRDLLRRVREATLGAYAHQDVPFEQVVDAVGAERALSHTPVFQVMFSMQNTPAARVGFAGLELRAGEWELTSAKFDLALTAAETGGQVKLLLDYATDLFDAATVDRMAAHLAAVLEAAAADPARKLSALPRMTDAEAAELRAWNRTAAEYPSADTLHGLFEVQAARTPNAVAVVYERETVTYAQLEARANRLAHRLRSMGVGAESRVGLCLERGVEMVVAILGTLKAGAAYLPLDPAYPAARLHHMLADAGVPVLLTQERLLGSLPEHAAAVLCLDCAETELERESAEPLDVSVEGEQAAYVIYTSGSTGLPKGVVVPHRAICNHMRWMQARFPLGAADAVLQKTPFSFDASVWEFHAPLMSGARLVMAAPGGHQDPAYLVDAIQAHGVTTLQLVPSLLRMLLEAEGLEACGTLNRVFCGGEALPAEWAAEAAARLPGAEVINLYGPTEAAIDSTFAVSTPADAHGTVPIGAPVANLQAHVVDRDGRELPAGVPGELWLGGAGVGRGYLGRPALTAEKFVPDAFSGVPGARAYRTGDRVRRRADGALDFLGRTDHQVKLRGYRLEPGEVEAALAAHPAVAAGVAMVREDEPGRARLAAYVVAHQGMAADPAELAAHLRGRLPEHMVPTAWAVLDAFPLTPSGKVDRRALPVPGALVSADEDAGAMTPSEQVLAGIWEEVLGVEGVGPAAHFFEMGGHSLLATRMVARVRAAFRVELPLRAVFEAPVLRALAARVDAARRADAGWAPAPILSVPREGGLPLSFAQERMWFLDQLEPGNAFYNIPVALRLRGALDAEALARAVDALVERHEVLRTVFAVGPDGAPRQVIQPANAGILSIEDLGALPEAERETAAADRARAEAHAGFDLAAGPVMRAALLRLSADEHVLLVTLHHVATDGWSTSILFRELWALYGAFAEGREAELCPLAVQYADYAVWQREHLAGERLQAQLGYWRGRLAGAPEVLELPHDRARPAVQSYRGGRIALRLDAELAAAVQALSRREGVTPYMTLLAAFQLLLSRWSGQDDVVVGTSIAGRTRPEAEPLVGLFVNTLALRGDLASDPTFRELLGRTRETVLEAYAHQEVPFEKLVEELRPERSLSHSPLFQVMFELANTPSSGAPAGGVEVSGFGQALDFAKFDLTLSLWEQGGAYAGVMEYAAALFDPSTVERMLGHYARLLASLVADPDRPVSAAEMMDEAGRAEAVERWNATDAAYPAHLRAHQVFERFAAETPDAPAVTFRGQTLSYARLNARANRAARRLRQMGVGAGTVVALLDERGTDLLTAILAVFKAGGAYLPLDPRHPPARIAQVLRQSGAPLVLAAEPLRAVLDAACAAVDPAPRAEDIAAMAADGVESTDLPTTCGPLDLAYVIYTSGSTGLPKGAMVHHDGMMNHLFAKVADLDLVATDTIAQTASQCFDISVWQMLAALVSGGRTLILADEVAGDPAGLPAALDANAVTIAEVVPSLLRVMAEEAARGTPSTLSALRWMLVTGEALPPAFCREWLAIYPAVPLLNAYGPTECSDDVTHHAVRTAPADDAPRVPIGSAIQNTRLYVVDRHLRPVSNGVLGELCVGGAGVGRGYLNEPKRTAGVFVPDPFSALPGARMYRTGDVARRLADGTLEFLGRIDHQVKVRGFRIELGEIEAVLRRHESVRDAVVTAVDDGRGARLVAHLVSPLAADALLPALRRHLADSLPEYMAPAAYVVMAALPLTPNGKVDRKALPAPDFSADAAAFVAPRTPVEAAVAGVWAELLGVERVGATDGFFELGGHSLLATRVLARLRETFRVDLPLRVMFEAPTVEALALELVARESKPGRTEKIARLLAEITAMSDDETQAALNGGGTPFTAGV